MFKVIVSPQAWDEFFEIFDFIAVSDGGVAASFCDGILDHIDLLSRFPQMGVASGKRPGIRSVLHTPIRIYYRVDEARQGVEVIHIWHTARQKPHDI